MDTPIMTGYYRYTDIWWAWDAVLPNPEDRGPLKAMFAHDSLVHPSHPLHKEGVDGIEMYMGTFQSGESRLLFSSAQVDYVRYWLHAMGLTKTRIRLPYSDCLLTKSELRTVSPVVFKDGGALRSSIKAIEKNNKRLKGSNVVLSSRRDMFEKIRRYWSEKSGVWCSLDFEAWDRDHTLLTEFGWSTVHWENIENGAPVEVNADGHLIVREHRTYYNSFVPNHRDNWNFGDSEVVSKSAFKSRISELLESLSAHGPLFLVFHDNNQDLKYLKTLDAPLDGLSFTIPDVMPSEGKYVVDTRDLFAALEGEAGNQNGRSLDRVCKHLQIYTEYLHNAGNDAHYTLLALKSMASGDPVDIQREKRWPNRTGPAGSRGVKVQFNPWEENSDYSDEEGIFPPLPGYDPKTGELIQD